MKPLLGKVGIVLIGLAIFGRAEAWGADWRVYGNAKGTIFSYKPESVLRSQKDIVKVLTKEEYLGERIAIERQETPDVSYRLVDMEINCAARRVRPLSFTAYSADGGVLGTHRIPGGKDEEYWAFVPPDSVGDNLLELLCK